MIPALVIGMFKGGLLEPYDSRLPLGFVQRVNTRVDVVGAEKFSHTERIEPYLERIVSEGHSGVEIFGIWLDYCVSQAASNASSLGLDVWIPEGFTYFFHHKPRPIENLVVPGEYRGLRSKEGEKFHYFSLK
jgi:hypothetical protein